MIYKYMKENYGFDVQNIKKMSGGWSSNVYLVETDQCKYVLKDIPIQGTNHPENEGRITSYLLHKGLRVSQFIKTKSDKYVWTAEGKQYHLQKYIDGETLELNTAPDWFMKKSAQYLGKAHKELSQHEKFPIGMGDDFFKHSSPEKAKRSYLKMLEYAKKMNDEAIVIALENRIMQIEKLKSITLDGSKFTCSNTHGDYYIYQMICKDNDFTIIDWTSACVHPICWEIIRSFSYADIECKNGGFSIERFFMYLQEYLKYFDLNQYDLEMMPYMFYYQLGVCNYYHSYYFDEDIDKVMALKIANLATNLMNWFFNNIDDLSRKLKDFSTSKHYAT